MAQLTFSANLQAALIPLVSRNFPRAVIVGRQNQTFVPGINSESAEVIPNREAAQCYYAHNVMPSTYGLRSVAFKAMSNTAYSITQRNSQDAFRVTPGRVLVNEETGAQTIVPQAGSVLLQTTYRNNPEASNELNFLALVEFGNLDLWIAAISDAPFIGNKFVTYATVNGLTFIFIANTGCFTYDANSASMRPVTLNGLNVSQVLGITTSNGYLIAYTSTSVVWSSVVNILDFTPSEITGAGGGRVQDAKGPITYVTPTSYGVMIYTTENAISMIYSGNENFPWNFKEIPGAGGIPNANHITRQSGSEAHFIYGTKGIQRITHVDSKPTLSQINDFLGGRVFEDFNNETNELEQETLQWPMAIKMNLVLDRFLIISYSRDPLVFPTLSVGNTPTKFTHALVYDFLTERMGKLKLSHYLSVDLGSFAGNVNSAAANEAIGFISLTGELLTLTFSETGMFNPHPPTMLLGRYQYVYERWLTLSRLEIDSARVPTQINVFNIPTFDGKNPQPPIAGFVEPSGDGANKYLFDSPGLNHSLLIIGNFNIGSLILWFAIGGRM